MKHLFSEFVSPDGTVMNANGGSFISVIPTEIINEAWVASKKINRRNSYRITPVSPTEYASESLNPEFGHQTGRFQIERNMLFFKFRIEGSEMDGYEIICRQSSVCYAHGALYDGKNLLNTWTTVSNKQF